jgi:phosphate transport system substrate-binding protein
VRRLDQAGREKGSGSPDQLAFSDGVKGDGYPQLLPRPIAFSLFTLVINKEAGVQDLSLQQIRQLYEGRITNWKEVGGNDQPVRLVGRHSGSGTRRTFEQQILGGTREPGDTSDDCQKLAPGAPPGVVRCARSRTSDVLDAVASTPGALGYSEVGAASGRRDLLLVRIDGHQATLGGADHGAYPFGETEYAYTYGEPRADSLAASFLRYLTNEVGEDIVRSHGHRPCAELQNPVLCRPS